MKNTARRASADRSPIEDPELTTVLRALYAAPADDGYWTGLEGRIMARLRRAEEQGEWWGVFAEWRAAGLVAAGLMLTLAGAALWKEYRMESEASQLAAGAAHWTVFDGPTDDMTIAFSVPGSRARTSGASDRYMFTAEP